MGDLFQKISQNQISSEFADHKTIASRLNAPVYFVHPHSPWERGTNENTNRILKQYFPKGTKAICTEAYLADCRQKINTRPRKCLNFASPAERFTSELRGCTSKLNVSTMVERNTRFLLVAHVPNKKAETVRNAILSMFRDFSQAVKTRELFEKSSLKPSKTFTHFAAMLQNGWGAGPLPCF